MRTLSARILLGFAALTITFAAITATIVANMQKIEEEIQLVRNGYVQLALLSRDFARNQSDLRVFLDEVYTDKPDDLRVQVTLRNIALSKLRKTLNEIEEKATSPREFENPRNRLTTIESAVDAAQPLYAKIAAAANHVENNGDADAALEALRKLRDAERKTSYEATELSKALERRTHITIVNLEENEHRTRILSIYLGLAAVVLGLLITIWVVITLRPLRQLRDAARRVAAGDYGSRIVERGPAEVSDLAREFNSMGRAVEERERELVRSERLAAVGKMAAMITHEVRNPLSSIGLNTELLEEELGESTGEAKQLCQSIHREVDRLTAITEEYLAFSRLPKPKIAREPVNKLVGSLAEFVKEDLAGKQVVLAVDLGSGDPTAMIDAAQIRQCLINLVRNASEACVAKGGGRVQIRTKKNAARVEIEVEDDGVGIAPDVLPRLFDPFFSTKESGSGLGLALTQQIVKDHGGDVTVESSVGKGTVFRVSVPAG